MPENKGRSLLNSQSWRNMSQSIATAVCNVSGAAYSRLRLNTVAKRVLPEHTRDALFQLFCDVRTNTPKDQVFFMRHAEALKPHTFTGWLAMLAALLYSTAGLALTSVGALGLMATVAFSSIFFAVVGGVMFAMFVGAFAITLTFASLGLVAVAGGAGTAATAGFVTFNFWKLVLQKLGMVRQRAHVTAATHSQQALPTSGPSSHSSSTASQRSSGQQGTFGSPIKGPGYTSLSSGAPGENTRQATHDKLTTEPAKDPFRKDIANPDDDINDIYGKGGSSTSSLGANNTGASDSAASAFGSSIRQGQSLFKGSSSSGGSTITTGAPAFTQKQATNDVDIDDLFGKGSSQGPQSSPPSGAQTFGGSSNSSKQTGAMSATNESDINDILGKGSSQSSQSNKSPVSPASDDINTSSKSSAAPSIGQPRAQSAEHMGKSSSGQAGGQNEKSDGQSVTHKGGYTNEQAERQAEKSGGQNVGLKGGDNAGHTDKSGGHKGGHKDGKHGGQSSHAGNREGTGQSGKSSSALSGSVTEGQGSGKGPAESASSESTGPNYGQVTNDADINDAFGKGGSHSSATHKAQSGASSRGSHSGGSGPTIKSSSNNATNDADINDVYGRGASHGGQNPNRGSFGPSNTEFGGFGTQDIGLQSNFRGPSGQQGPYGSSGPRGSATMHDSNFVSQGGRNAY